MSHVPSVIKQIDETTWEIPQSYKKGMQVPARIVATQKLLREMDTGVFDQVTNVAMLPGLQKYALCMPDGHWGYGFPIGGVAAFDTETGIISPGGIGFDINCITGDSKIITEYGYFLPIKTFENKFDHTTKSINLTTKQETATRPILFMKKRNQQVYTLTTKSGATLTATKDHPFYTQRGMVPLQDLQKNDLVAINPFVGVAYEEPNDMVVLDEEDIRRIAPGREKIIKKLKSKHLLPLRFNSEKLPILARLVGFTTGDGWLGYYYSKKRKQNMWSTRFIGKEEDLLLIQKDIQQLGFNCRYMQTKKYTSVVSEYDGSQRVISGHSTQLYMNTQSLTILLHALGVPKGNKSFCSTRVPSWIKETPLWMKRLYLAGLFGAELSKPQQGPKELTSFKEPSFNQNKIEELEQELSSFMREIKELLSCFGVECTHLYRLKGIVNKQGKKTIKLSLKISAKLDNLVKLWSTLGFEYCQRKKRLSLHALQYLNHKKFILQKTDVIVAQALSYKEQGVRTSLILHYAVQQDISPVLVNGRLWSKSRQSRISRDFPTFENFVHKYNAGTFADFLWDPIVSIEEKPVRAQVYDFTINHEDHNFIANSFVISNCGMRLLTTNLTIKDVQPRLKALVDHIFKTVPAGVGCKGFVKVNHQQFDEVMTDGVKWCVDNDYGWKEDIMRCEGKGKIDWADPSKVTDKAKKRGIDQLGTLGSGNHYLEIQVVKKENIYDATLAKKFGITQDGQIVVMIHCGSRGFGHQIATDYLRTFETAMKKYNITVPDKELSCAPFSSKEGQDYYKAMACAANMAFANRQVILHRVREAFEHIFKQKAEDMEMNLIYDVAHNVAKVEEHKIDGKKKQLVVHRKGSTRAFPPGHPELIPLYRETGQPVILGGSMETGSALLVGTQKAMDETFASTAHGSGRTMSRTEAKRTIRGEDLQKSMEKRGIYVRTTSYSGLAEEAGAAYKEITDVIDTLNKSGISKSVVLLRPIGNVKG